MLAEACCGGGPAGQSPRAGMRQMNRSTYGFRVDVEVSVVVPKVTRPSNEPMTQALSEPSRATALPDATDFGGTV